MSIDDYLFNSRRNRFGVFTVTFIVNRVYGVCCAKHELILDGINSIVLLIVIVQILLLI